MHEGRKQHQGMAMLGAPTSTAQVEKGLEVKRPSIKWQREPTSNSPSWMWTGMRKITGTYVYVMVPGTKL